MYFAIPASFNDSHSIGKWIRSRASRNSHRTAQDAGPRTSVRAIDRNEIFEVKQASGVTIECLEGSVWVTLDGDMRDVILDAGHAFKVDRKQLTS